ncbi:hypothetical protein Sango_0424000 [Sesamum angolense]|uniref:Uncharacterized protein n=1 Tax=Sesamum angolense TaxID=2727404 RepID=A0AAE1XAW0_9LAMI|nr:hypothetical protein Sango_0424000 [Sesamum angolense]
MVKSTIRIIRRSTRNEGDCRNGAKQGNIGIGTGTTYKGEKVGKLLQLLNSSNVSLERQSQDTIINAGVEQSVGQRYSSCISTSKARDRHSRILGVSIVLKVHQPFREHKYVSLLERLRVKRVFGVDESHLQRALCQKQELGGPQVDVDRVHGSARVYEDCIGNALAYEGWELFHCCLDGCELRRDWGGDEVAEAGEGEEVAVDGGEFSGRTKSVRMSGSPARVMWAMAREVSSMKSVFLAKAICGLGRVCTVDKVKFSESCTNLKVPRLKHMAGLTPISPPAKTASSNSASQNAQIPSHIICKINQPSSVISVALPTNSPPDYLIFTLPTPTVTIVTSAPEFSSDGQGAEVQLGLRPWWGQAGRHPTALVISSKPGTPPSISCSIDLTSFKLNFPVLDAEMILTVHVTNPNVVPIHYSDTDMSIFYAGSLLRLPVQAGSQPPAPASCFDSRLGSTACSWPTTRRSSWPTWGGGRWWTRRSTREIGCAAQGP